MICCRFGRWMMMMMMIARIVGSDGDGDDEGCVVGEAKIK